MGLTIPTLPTGSETGRKTKRPTSIARHSPLHMMPGLKHCHCMCNHCWQPLGHTSAGQARGKCICRDCPCNHREL